MNYLGGKARLSRHIAAVMLRLAEGRALYVEPFLGGASVAERMVPHFEAAHLSDVHPDLAALWQAAAAGWVPPAHAINEELYERMRHAEDASALRGFLGFGCSYGGRWFAGFIGRHPKHSPETSARSMAKRGEALHGARIGCGSFFDLDPPAEPGAVVYLDPPYRGTQRYDGTPRFNHDRFWRRAEEWALAGAQVFVSEYEAPGAWRSVWAQAVGTQLQGGASTRARVERLFAHVSMVRSLPVSTTHEAQVQGRLF